MKLDQTCERNGIDITHQVCSWPIGQWAWDESLRDGDKSNGVNVCAGQVMNNSVRTLTSALSEASSHYWVFSQAVIWGPKSSSYVCLSITSFQDLCVCATGILFRSCLLFQWVQGCFPLFLLSGSVLLYLCLSLWSIFALEFLWRVIDMDLFVFFMLTSSCASSIHWRCFHFFPRIICICNILAYS